MKYQIRSYSCGSATIVNALKLLNTDIPETEVIKLANTNKEEGTPEPDMLRAIKKLGFAVGTHEDKSWQKSWRWLQDSIKKGQPVILAVDNWGHYVNVLANFSTQKVILFDPAGSIKPQVKKENGIFVLSKKELKERWLNNEENLYFGLCIKEKN